MEIPWLGKTKDLRHELFDVMAKLPTILHQFDEAKSFRGKPAEEDALRFQFFQACKDYDNAIQAWLVVLRARAEPELIEQVSSGIPESLDIKNIVFAQTMALYWTMCCIFYGTVHFAFEHFQVSRLVYGCEPRFDPRQYAGNIARSVKFFLNPDAGMSSAQSFSFPMGMALNFFSSTNTEATTEYRLITAGFSQGLNGLLVKKFLLSIKTEAKARICNDHDDEEDTTSTEYSCVRQKAREWFDTSKPLVSRTGWPDGPHVQPSVHG
jgi:hypothetical protein